MNYYLLYVVVLFLISTFTVLYKDKDLFSNFAIPLPSRWWERSDWRRFGYSDDSYLEGFENKNDRPFPLDESSSVIFEYPPDTPSPADLYNTQPYHLLSDKFAQPNTTESLSHVNSRSCYATDFNQSISKIGNFRQLTNNYKRDYPDSCSAPNQELVLNFYKTDGITIPK